MSPELIGFLSALGAMVVTIIGVWLKTEIPMWFRNRQKQDDKKLDSELKIREKNLDAERTSTEKLIEIGFGVVNRLPDMIKEISAGHAKVTNDLKDVHIDLIGRLELIKNQVLTLEMTIKDLKIQSLNPPAPLPPDSRMSANPPLP